MDEDTAPENEQELEDIPAPPLRRANSIVFRQQQEINFREGVEEMTKTVTKSIVTHTTTGLLLLFFVLLSGGAECGDGIRLMVKESAYVHFLFVPFEI
eukprot:CAMPEP_0168329460 /NCGR_PEP_ID=MMETSP0213-20121227/7123_1 /TAXON_ID=151035 /ORGANISM="Euplotes harpa, Strain FSP1.4" /LENGTH=97 /DNA_ID=CAMNT_0008332793 /DNA_START=9 /DNA_END=302 /DNA_ORIENTATION=-